MYQFPRYSHNPGLFFVLLCSGIMAGALEHVQAADSLASQNSDIVYRGRTMALVKSTLKKQTGQPSSVYTSESGSDDSGGKFVSHFNKKERNDRGDSPSRAQSFLQNPRDCKEQKSLAFFKNLEKNPESLPIVKSNLSPKSSQCSGGDIGKKIPDVSELKWPALQQSYYMKSQGGSQGGSQGQRDNSVNLEKSVMSDLDSSEEAPGLFDGLDHKTLLKIFLKVTKKINGHIKTNGHITIHPAPQKSKKATETDWVPEFKKFLEEEHASDTELLNLFEKLLKEEPLSDKETLKLRVFLSVCELLEKRDNVKSMDQAFQAWIRFFSFDPKLEKTLEKLMKKPNSRKKTHEFFSDFMKKEVLLKCKAQEDHGGYRTGGAESVYN